jgi:hypothetical protein
MKIIQESQTLTALLRVPTVVNTKKLCVAVHIFFVIITIDTGYFTKQY